ncbi:MAG: YfhO family protein, partial [Candidatus Kryptoniota bacterium]
MMSDLTVSLLISAATSLVIYLFLKKKLSFAMSAFTFLVILLFDMWRVDVRPMFYSDKQDVASIFAKPDYVSYIQRDTTLYRVIQLQNHQPVTSNTLAYFLLQNAYGYTGAKLRNYQNMMEVAGITNPNVMRLLGIKYIISDKPDNSLGVLAFSGTQLVYKNNNILPRAFFVERYQVAPALEILEDLRDGKFDPVQTAYFQTDPGVQIEKPDSSASVRVVDYKLQEMKIDVHASGNNFLVISEIYYPKGWHAFIDGKPAEIYPVDYFLRGLSIPKGNHIVTLKFEPRTYYVGRGISIATNVLIIIWLTGSLAVYLINRKKELKDALTSN